MARQSRTGRRKRTGEPAIAPDKAKARIFKAADVVAKRQSAQLVLTDRRR